MSRRTKPVFAMTASDRQKYDQRWNDIWEKGLEPGQRFDMSGTSPALLSLLASGKLQVQGKRVLIPGCGRGYDVIDFAKQGAATAVGMELVPKATVAAQTHLDASDLDIKQRERAQIVTGDFFDVTQEHAYDIGYDYTFFCAMDPTVRKQWAETWAKWLQPGGQLVTLMFPVEPEGREGPPWPVPLELYQELLPPQGFKQTYLQQVPPEQCHKGREGRTWIGCWTKSNDSSQ